jgi:ADP-ribose pyrophosphatase YjhB (NUDIX family)
MSKLWYEGANQAVDIVVTKGDEVLLIKRKDTGQWALPGGFVTKGEPFIHAAARELHEETGLVVNNLGLGVWGASFYHGSVTDPRNDKDSWVVTVAYHIEYTQNMGTPKSGDDAIEVKWVSLGEVSKMHLYGSHGQLIAMAVYGI